MAKVARHLDLSAPCAVNCGRGAARTFRLEKSPFQVVGLSIRSLGSRFLAPYEKTDAPRPSSHSGNAVCGIQPDGQTPDSSSQTWREWRGPRPYPDGLKDSEPPALGSGAAGSLCPRPLVPRPLAELFVGPAQRSARPAFTHA